MFRREEAVRATVEHTEDGEELHIFARHEEAVDLLDLLTLATGEYPPQEGRLVSLTIAECHIDRGQYNATAKVHVSMRVVPAAPH